VPHAVRLVVGPSHRRVVPASALAGATFVIAADIVARTAHRPEEIALGVITASCGAPFFLWLLSRYRREVGYL
jgi:iron complex transport system permease protein